MLSVAPVEFSSRALMKGAGLAAAQVRGYFHKINDGRPDAATLPVNQDELTLRALHDIAPCQIGVYHRSRDLFQDIEATRHIQEPPDFAGFIIRQIRCPFSDSLKDTIQVPVRIHP